MKKKYSISLALTAVMSFSVEAINVGEITSMMSSDSSILAKEVSNTTDTARYVSLSVERISSPMAGGVVIPMESKSELLSTPASLIMPAEASENFRFIYKGPEDDKERYYRLSWTDEPVTEQDASKSAKLGQATTSAIISTILVVAPRKERFDFVSKDGKITNTGNSSFRVISYGPCRDTSRDIGKGCRERYYLMPGISTKIQYTDLTNKKTRIGIWHDGKYINVE